MTIKAIKEKYRNYQINGSEHNSFVTWDWQNGDGKCVIIVNGSKNKYVGRYVTQIIRVSDGKELLKDGACRPCDNLDDAIDVAGEMLMEGGE